jgi:hypothetical protein
MLTVGQTIIGVDATSIPQSLIEQRRWVCWAAVPKQRNDGTEEFTKVPRRPDQPRVAASSTDASTWATFDEALAAYEAGAVAGIGFVLGDGIMGIDLDSVRDPDTGALEPAAQAIVERLDTYTEVSPSGTGVKMILRGTVPQGRKRPADGLDVEMYPSGRFFTLTGLRVPGTPPEVADADEARMAEIMRLWEQMGPAASERPAPSTIMGGYSPTDAEVVEVGSRVCSGFDALWGGDSSRHGDDESAGDQGLANHLAWLCGPNGHGQVRRLLMQSGRKREKFEQHKTYLDRTIGKAYESVRDFYQWRGHGQARQIAGGTAITPPAVLPNVSREWKPFPVELLPSCVRDYVEQTAEGMAADPSMVALPLLAGLASATGNTRTIMLKDDWDEPSILWTAVVAESGSLKTPTQRAALRFTADREAGIEEQNAAALEAYDADRMIHETRLAAWKQEARRAGDRDPGTPPAAPTKPPRIACIVSDSTVEAIAGILADNPRGVLLERDELAGWLAGFDRYKSGGAGRVSSEVGHWLSMHSAGTLRVDRKSTGRVYVPRASLSIAGGIQPATLTQAIGREHLANGLLARFLLAAPPRRRKQFNTTTADFATVEAMRMLFDILHGLVMQDGEPKRLPLSADGKAAFAEFYERHAIRLEKATGPMASMLAKAEATAARLALVIHVCRQAGGEPNLPHAVDAESIRRGVGLAEWFAAEWERVYEATVGGEAKSDPETELLGWIEMQGGEVPVRDIHDRMKRFNKDAALLERTVTSLAARGLLETFSVQSPRGGRPASWIRRAHHG